MSAINDQQDVKREKILDAAYNRFLHYGYSKTTMNEIATDLSMSKALLYYYFPDKSQLYVAIMRKLANDYMQVVDEKMTIAAGLKDAFISQVNIKHEFMLKNYNFFDFFRINEQNLPDQIWEIITQIHQKEIHALSQLVADGVERGQLNPVEDTKMTIGLLLDALHGVRVSSFSAKKSMFPSKDQMEEIHQKRLLLIDIFVRGLSC
jgi:AcrR family transcriptional regulator